MCLDNQLRSIVHIHKCIINQTLTMKISFKVSANLLADPDRHLVSYF